MSDHDGFGLDHVADDISTLSDFVSPEALVGDPGPQFETALGDSDGGPADLDRQHSEVTDAHQHVDDRLDPDHDPDTDRDDDRDDIEGDDGDGDDTDADTPGADDADGDGHIDLAPTAHGADDGLDDDPDVDDPSDDSITTSENPIGLWTDDEPSSPLATVVSEMWDVDVPEVDHLIVPGSVGTTYQMAAALERSGVEATIVHGDLETISDHVDSGSSVFITVDGETGPVAMRIVDVQWDQDQMVVVAMDGSSTATVSLDVFEDAWSETANQLMIVEPPIHDDDVIALPNGPYVAIPVHVHTGDLAPITSGRHR